MPSSVLLSIQLTFPGSWFQSDKKGKCRNPFSICLWFPTRMILSWGCMIYHWSLCNEIHIPLCWFTFILLWSHFHNETQERFIYATQFKLIQPVEMLCWNIEICFENVLFCDLLQYIKLYDLLQLSGNLRMCFSEKIHGFSIFNKKMKYSNYVVKQVLTCSQLSIWIVLIPSTNAS